MTNTHNLTVQYQVIAAAVVVAVDRCWVVLVCSTVAKSFDNTHVVLMSLLYCIYSYLNPMIPYLLTHVPIQTKAYVDAQSIWNNKYQMVRMEGRLKVLIPRTILNQKFLQSKANKIGILLINALCSYPIIYS